MKRRTTFSVLFGVLGLTSLVGVGSVHATLKFQTTQPVQFTFNPTLSLNVSGDLIVSNLTAGDNADSNEITIAVNTNVASGYYLTATAGTASTTTNLVNTSNNSYTFTSLATNASLDDMSSANDNEWGYAFKVGSNTYSNYSGLPLDNDDSGKTGAVLVNTSDPADSKVVTFKIGAKAATGQPAGVYTNTINFFAVTAPLSDDKTINDLEYMQDFATLTTGEKSTVLASMTQDEEYQLDDIRDGKPYYISKLVDGNVWMTQNLDLDLGMGVFYPDDTDISEDWIPELSGYSSDTNPSFYDPGDLCWNGIITDDATGTLDNMTESCSLDDPSHYYVGNYYNWTAAVAMNDSSDLANDEDVDQSICPAGWRLPIYEGNKSYDNLTTAMSLTSGTDGDIQNHPVYFVYGGVWNDYTTGVGYGGLYWSSVANDIGFAYDLGFNADGYLEAQEYDGRSNGLSVRCVAR
ncbi:hypothetical protein IKF43_01400 [Candidatus Saccharibacteria bacterium]|nr:hypothetical protein [Candidatus Saccharibacteria bacterium]